MKTNRDLAMKLSFAIGIFGLAVWGILLLVALGAKPLGYEVMPWAGAAMVTFLVALGPLLLGNYLWRAQVRDQLSELPPTQ